MEEINYILLKEETKEILLKIVSQLQDIAIEQATREISGTEWGEQKVNELDVLKQKIRLLP